ncbi:MAG TPA: tetratricopeptide repeat protein [Saprospiraceae bacterium]|nr:tetratricopeptide repeat protein [Saprospiraceae bacterium]HPI05467.1 tetratricopeptide repeat protein [Saprospiraceae bacterium]
MKSFLFILTIWCSTAPVAFLQPLRAWERAGDLAVENKDYGAAIQYYDNFLKKQQDDLDVWWKYADCARLISAYSEAEKGYDKVAHSKKAEKKFPLLEYRMGEVKKSQGDYDKALKHFEKFLHDTSGLGIELREEVTREIAHLQDAKSIAATPAQVEIKHLGREVNSPFSDFAPIVVGDTLFFSSYRFDKKDSRRRPKDKITKVMISAKGGRAREPGKGFPVADTAHIAHTAFSPDGHYVVFTVCQDVNPSEIKCELWLTVIDRRNRWLPPVRLPEPVNMPGYTTTQPSIGYDEHYQGPVLWFSSDRPGGKGNLDLWYLPLDTVFFCECALPIPGKKIGKLPRFSKPVNAAALNTPENDATPFFHSPTQKIFYSSDGLPGLGGYDIFLAGKDEETFSEPRNAGVGLNSSYNDLYYFLKKDSKNGYLSSNRPGSFYLDEASKSCCNDIFSFKLPREEEKYVPLSKEDTIPTLATPPPQHEQDPEPQPTPPTVKEPELADFVGLPLYFDNDEPDKRTRRSFTKKQYEETVLTYLEKQDEYRSRFSQGLSGARSEAAENLTDDFFENEVRRGYDRLIQLADLLLVRMQKGEQLEVLIKGFTSPRAKSDYNLELGKRRVSSVKNYFDFFADGALKPYIQSGQLKLSEVSFGETNARHNISDDLHDERNSVYHPDAARERRVEIVEIRKGQ